MENGQLITEYKGAPEVLLAHAKKYMTNDGKILPLNLDKLNAKIDDLANSAMRVLCFGYSKQSLKENIINDDTIITSLEMMYVQKLKKLLRKYKMQVFK